MAFDLKVGAGLLSKVSKGMEAANQFHVILVPFDEVQPNELNEGFSLDEIDELATSILEVGLQQNFVMKTIKDGEKYKYKILSGHRRYLAYKLLLSQGHEEYEQLPTVIREPESIELPLSPELKEIYAIATTNVETRKNTPADNLKMVEMMEKVYEELKKNRYPNLGKRREYIAERLGVSPATVKNLKYIGENLIPEFKKGFEEQGGLTVTGANEIAHLSEKDQQELFKKTKNPLAVTVEEVNAFRVEKIKNEQAPIKKKLQALTQQGKKPKTVEVLEYDTYIKGTELFDELNEQLKRQKQRCKDNVVFSRKEYAMILDALEVIGKQMEKVSNAITMAQKDL